MKKQIAIEMFLPETQIQKQGKIVYLQIQEHRIVLASF